MFLLFACNNTTEKNEKNNNSQASVVKKFSPEVQKMEILLSQHPDSAGLRLKLAITLDSIKEYHKAILQVDTLLKKDSLNYGFWFTKGSIAEDMGDTLLAMQSYDKALRIYPSADAMLALANLYAEQKNERSLLICAQVKKLSLGREYDAHADFISGVYNARTGNKERALEFFDNCIANDYTYMEAYIEKGLLYFDSKDYVNALNIFKFASSVNALDDEPYYWQGRCYEMMNIKDSAIMRFKQALSLNVGDSATEAALKRLGD